jgi:hypothetical protein
MKKLFLLLFLLCALLLVPVSARAQSTLIQHAPTVLNGCTPSHSDAAINTLVTITITPPNGQYVYVCGIDFQVAHDNPGAAVAFTTVKWTSTNLGGLAYLFSLPAVVNTMYQQSYQYPFPVKSVAPGTAITFVSPPVNAHAMFSANVYYYFAP